MKRRYKEGDWFAVPLAAGREAVGIIARADRSRLYGYFFASERREPADAFWRGFFRGDGLEDARWRRLSRLDGFTRERWPLPPGPAASFEAIPDARFEPAALIERRLRGVADALAIREVRSPLDRTRFESASPAVRLQYSEPLDEADLDALARAVRARPQSGLRVHGFRRHAFDPAQLARFAAVRHLHLDVALPSFDVLGALAPHLESLVVGPRAGAAFDPPPLPRLRALELHGAALSRAALRRLPSLRALTLVDSPLRDLGALAGAELERLIVRYGDCDDVAAIVDCANLRELDLRGLRGVRSLPPLGALARLQTLAIADLPNVTDLRPVVESSTLARIEIDAMAHLAVNDLYVLRELRALASAEIDIGGRRKNREVYRALGLGPGGRNPAPQRSPAPAP